MYLSMEIEIDDDGYKGKRWFFSYDFWFYISLKFAIKIIFSFFSSNGNISFHVPRLLDDPYLTCCAHFYEWINEAVAINISHGAKKKIRMFIDGNRACSLHYTKLALSRT